ncbi:MAG TPA: SGNH/GDSL hydrolase family protein [Deltaproteobacteria bacterium]|nr:SGNH/GDSL hydrolase family protein [Deltaproteobacteria bacterium]
MQGSPRRILITLLALGLGGIIALLLLEVGLRIYNPIPRTVRGRSITLPVNRSVIYTNPMKTSKVDRQVTVTRNRLGFRGPDPPDDLDAWLSVIAVGGSTTECRFLSDDRTWPALVAARLDAVYDSVWLNNAGLDGHSTFGHMVLLEQIVLDLHPDYLLLLVGVNDVGRDDLSQFDLSIDPAAQSLRDRFIAASELLSTMQVLYRSLHASRLGLEHLRELDLTTVPRIPVDERAIAAAVRAHRTRFTEPYSKRLTRIVEMSRAAGSEPVLITQPVLWGETVDPTTGIDLGPLAYSGTNGATRWRVLEAYNDVTRRIGAEHGVLVIDAARRMPKDSRLYYDWMHYSNEGAAEMAGIVASELIPWIERRSALKSPSGSGDRADLAPRKEIVTDQDP